MPKSGEFYTFDEVLHQLDIDEQKLKRLVSEGEIRAFREGDEMKFKRSDIDTLDMEASEDGETREVDLSAGGGDASETLTDDLIFDEGDELTCPPMMPEWPLPRSLPRIHLWMRAASPSVCQRSLWTSPKRASKTRRSRT